MSTPGHILFTKLKINCCKLVHKMRTRKGRPAAPCGGGRRGVPRGASPGLQGCCSRSRAFLALS